MSNRDDEPQLRPDELRVLRQMMSEYRDGQVVGRWLGAKWRIVVAVAGTISAAAVLTASVLEIAKTARLIG